MQNKHPDSMLLRTTSQIRRWVGAAALAALAFMALFVAFLGLLAWKTGAFEPGWRVEQIHTGSVQRDIGGRAK